MNGKMITGFTAAMATLIDHARRAAPTKAPILVLGETGTGKELLAKEIHALSQRKDKPFVAINCAAVPRELLAATLFGHVRGAFTDAHANKAGLFEDANGGTLFLDEIGEMPLDSQVKFLRALQEGEVTRVGSNDVKKVDVRIIAATNRDLAARVRDGHFREDLYYRLNVIPLYIPPLRERVSDIPELANHFLSALATSSGVPLKVLSPEALERLCAYRWPGNIRELENVIQRAFIFTEGETIAEVDIPNARVAMRPVESLSATSHGHSIPESGAEYKVLLAECERSLLREALARTGGHRGHAAGLLRLNRTTFTEKMRRFGVEWPTSREEE